MLKSINYSIFNKYPNVECKTVWSTNSEQDLSISSEMNLNEIKFNLSSYGLNPDRMVMAQQVHGNSVKTVEEGGILNQCDGLVTDRSGLYLCIRTADCAAVMIYDRANKVIGNLHSGWRGIHQKIIANGVSLMIKQFSSRPENLIIGVSPFIQSCCYEVGIEFKKIFSAQHLYLRGGKFFLDLNGEIMKQLLDLNIPKYNIEVSGDCTYCSAGKLPSYRRTKTKNRLVNMIKLKENENV